jgi:hypothetical protein
MIRGLYIVIHAIESDRKLVEKYFKELETGKRDANIDKYCIFNIHSKTKELHPIGERIIIATIENNSVNTK